MRVKVSVSNRIFSAGDDLITVAARGLVNGRGPLRSSGRDLVFKSSPVEFKKLTV